MAGNRLGSLADSSSCAKKRCLTLSNRDSAADLAFGFNVEPETVSTTRVCSSAACQVAMDDRPGLGIGVVDLDLRRRELVLEQVIFDAGEGQRTRRVDAERLEVAGDQLHRRDTALADAGDERLAVGERRSRSPEPEPCRIAEVGDVGGAGGRDVEDASAGEMVLQPQTCDALLRSFDPAA